MKKNRNRLPSDIGVSTMREDYCPNEYRFPREDYYPLGYRDDEEMCVYDQCCENCAMNI